MLLLDRGPFFLAPEPRHRHADTRVGSTDTAGPTPMAIEPRQPMEQTRGSGIVQRVKRFLTVFRYNK